MPKIVVNDDTFMRMQRHTTPLVDDVNSVINKAFDALEHQLKPEANAVAVSYKNIDIETVQFSDVNYTKVISAKVSGKRVTNPTWNAIFREIITFVKLNGFEKSGILEIASNYIVEGEKTDHAYKYEPKIDLSIRAISARDACKITIEIARTFKFGLEILFEWENTPNAKYPGEKGRIMLNTD